jgi:hypothetical protein
MTTAKTMTLRVLKRIKLDDNRELQILRIPTGTDEDLIRLGVNLLPGGEHLSGAVFPESHLDEVIDALRGAKRPTIKLRRSNNNA